MIYGRDLIDKMNSIDDEKIKEEKIKEWIEDSKEELMEEWLGDYEESKEEIMKEWEEIKDKIKDEIYENLSKNIDDLVICIKEEILHFLEIRI